jgi:hypothetical protein
VPRPAIIDPTQAFPYTRPIRPGGGNDHSCLQSTGRSKHGHQQCTEKDRGNRRGGGEASGRATKKGGREGALTVLGELEEVGGLVEEVSGVLVLGTEESPSGELLLRLLLEFVPARLVIAHRRQAPPRSVAPLWLEASRRLRRRDRLGSGKGRRMTWAAAHDTRSGRRRRARKCVSTPVPLCASRGNFFLILTLQ